MGYANMPQYYVTRKHIASLFKFLIFPSKLAPHSPTRIWISGPYV